MNQRKTLSRGYTLIELVMVLAAASVIASLSATLVHAMLRQQSAASRQLAIGNSLVRIGDRFRNDVNAALKAKVTDQEIVLSHSDDRSISWRRDGAAMIRTIQVGSDVRNDYFDLQPDHAHAFVRNQIAGGAEFVGIEIKPDEDLTDASAAKVDMSSLDPRHQTGSRGSTIFAELGRDHRWQRLPESEVSP